MDTEFRRRLVVLWLVDAYTRYVYADYDVLVE